MANEQPLDAHELAELLDQVTDESTFLVFVEALAADQRLEAEGNAGRGSRGWGSHSVGGFLERGANWARDSRFGRAQGLGDANPWKRFAVFLYCGKIYE